MDFKKFNKVAELVGIVALIASLVFVGMEIRQSQLIALTEVDAANSIASIELASLINDSSDVWGRGIAGEDLDDAETETFRNIIIALSDRNWAMQHQLRMLGDDENADTIVHDFAAFLHQRPGARSVWSKRESKLKEDRSLLNPKNLNASPYVEMVMANFKALDQRGHLATLDRPR